MAKNIFENLLELTGFKPPSADGYYDPSVYVQDTPPQKQAEPSTPPPSGRKSRVEQYLAKKQPLNISPTNTEDSSLTGVARYLASKEHSGETEAASMTGVERYLLQRKGKVAATPAAKTAPALTGVDKYLADKKKSGARQPAVTADNKNKVTQSASAKEPAAAKKPETKPESTNESAENKPARQRAQKKTVNLADSATQCQAATQKGTQCRRKNNLVIIDKTIDSQKYQFAVCSQHNNVDFAPIADLIR